MTNILKINAPVVEHLGEKQKVRSSISYNEHHFELWFECDADDQTYFCSERSDGFLVCLLPWAMLKSKKEGEVRIECEGPVSSSLYSHLTDQFIPLLTKKIGYYGKVDIHCPCSSEIIGNQGFVGTGVSCGVDSCYTVAKYYNDVCSKKLTHLVYFSMGLYGDLDNDTDKAIMNKAKNIAKDTGLSLLKIKSNVIHQLYNKGYAPIVPFVFMGSILGMQSFFNCYYYSSGYSADDFKISEIDAAYFDLLTTKAFSTDCLEFISSGYDVTRSEKVAYISNHSFTYDNLSVCLEADQTQGNCGRCAKCTRTMCELDSIGKLELYKNSFDLDDYYANYAYHWGYILLKAKSDVFCEEVLTDARKRGIHIGIKVYASAAKKWIKRGFQSKNPNHQLIDAFYNKEPWK